MGKTDTPRRGFCIYTNPLFQEPTLAVKEGDGPCVFSTEAAAQREIADFMMTRLREFIDGERDFNDAITVEEYVVPVTVLPDGSVVDGDGQHFGKEV
ncbi:MAG: hypothetical protein JF599_02490 [Verrucomicrobia bacterium]|nr:hypothetical protein [Verrucomicrobiota bacterium]